MAFLSDDDERSERFYVLFHKSVPMHKRAIIRERLFNLFMSDESFFDHSMGYLSALQDGGLISSDEQDRLDDLFSYRGLNR